jgi:hypothetical protein
VQRLLADARASGFTTAQLWVHTDNAAARVLYAKFGFVSTGTRSTTTAQVASSRCPRICNPTEYEGHWQTSLQVIQPTLACMPASHPVRTFGILLATPRRACRHLLDAGAFVRNLVRGDHQPSRKGLALCG